MRKFIKCKCGHNITTNVWARHMNSGRCSLSSDEKNVIQILLDKRQEFKWAWRVELGKDAVGECDWYLSVINEETTIDDWVFISPRKLGETTPKNIKKMKEVRVGTKNPMSRSKPKYDIDKIKIFAKNEFEIIKNDNNKLISSIHLKIEEVFPGYLYNCPYNSTQKNTRGANTKNLKLCHVLDITIEYFIEISAKRRGVSIKSGQEKSPKRDNIIEGAKKGLKKNGYFSNPHRILFKMIKSVDINATIEFRIDYLNTWRSYDIYSEKINTVIEMHGYAWHAICDNRPGIAEKVIKNIENDKIKKKLAIDNGYNFVVFWDNEVYNWDTKIKELFGLESVSYEKAKNQVSIENKGSRGV